MVNVHFIVCNYNAERKNHSLTNALTALSRLKNEGVYIHMVDNASKDGSQNIISRFSQLNVIDTVLLLRLNRGKAFALNRLYETACALYDVKDNDVIVSMDSDIIIEDQDFISRLREIISHSNAAYIGYTLYDDDTCSKVSPYIQFSKYEKRVKISGHEYSIVDKQSGLAGGVISIRNSLYKKIKYNEHLGRNGHAAVYGGDDAVLTLNLFRSGYPGVFDLSSRIIHYSHDQKYSDWKNMVIDKMISDGFGSSNIPEKGFYD